MSAPIRFCCVVGARPNFVKAAPLVTAIRGSEGLAATLVHTGQHYDRQLSKVFFDDLEMPEPDVHLQVGSGSHAQQTGRTMERLEPVLAAERPAAVIVFGDVNATVAAALTAAKLNVPVAHVEAGLRSFDPRMPEEINRRVTDCISDLLFVTEQSGAVNLVREGVPEERIHFVGNTMVDSLFRHLDRARPLLGAVRRRLGLEPGEFAVVTLHRPSNVDRPEILGSLVRLFARLSREIPIVLPLHPRTRQKLEAIPDLRPSGLAPELRLCEPLGYLEFLSLMDGARLVMTDSGGIQEETTALGVACLTLRENTERPVTVDLGTNQIVGQDPRVIEAAARELLQGDGPTGKPRPPLWDGHAAERIVEVLRRFRFER